LTNPRQFDCSNHTTVKRSSFTHTVLIGDDLRCKRIPRDISGLRFGEVPSYLKVFRVVETN